jgi:TetR/AcrR family transcriptional repressor of nem operon
MRSAISDPAKQSSRSDTRRRILDAAYALVLRHGYTATTVDRVLRQTGLTKGAFFHYFQSKSDLALALIERYAAEGRESLHAALVRAEQASEDPLEQLLFFHRDVLARAESPEPAGAPLAGCLIACAAYELEAHSPEVRAVMRSAVMHYRSVLTSKLREVAARYQPRMPVDPAELAEHLYGVYDGGLVIGRLLGDSQALARQLRQTECYLRLLFAPAPWA